MKSSIFNSLDCHTLIKACQTISQEINFKHLLTTIAKVLIEITAAQKVILLLKNKDNWSVEAIETQQEQIEVSHWLTKPLRQVLPICVINIINEQQDILHLEATTDNELWQSDDYLVSHSIQSLCCLPILEKNQLIGMLYLENHLKTNAFAASDFDALQVISSQIAIALKNARLYEQLAVQKSRYHRLVEKLPHELILTLNQDFQLTFFGGQNDSQFNLKAQMSLEELLNPEEWKKLEPHLQAAFLGQSSSCEVMIQKLPLVLEMIPIEPTEGTIAEILLISQNPKETQTVEDALRESEAQYRRIVETAQEGIWMIDAENKTSFVNPKMAQMLGYRIEEMMGRSLFDFMDEQGQVETLKNLERHHRGITEPFDFKFRHKEGHSIWTIICDNPILDQDGNYCGALGMITDITARKQAEFALQRLNYELEQRVEQRTQELAKQTQLLQTLLNCMGDGVIAIDSVGQIFIYNPAAEKITGLSISSPKIEQWQEYWGVYHTDGITPYQIHELPLVRAMQGDSMDRLEVMLRNVAHPEGIYVEATVRPILKPSGEIIGGVSVFRDISERKKVEAEQQKLISLVESSADFIGMFDLSGKALYLNEAGMRMIGLSDYQIIKTQLNLSDLLFLEDVEIFQQIILPTVMAKGSYRKEFRFRHILTQEVIDVDFLIFTIHDPITGQPNGLATVTRDIRERKRLEKEQKQLLALLEASPDFIGMVTSEQQVFWLNTQARQIRNLPADIEVSHLRIQDWHPQWAFDLIQNQGIPSANEKGMWIGETALINSKGQEISVSQLILSHKNASGEIEFLSTIMRDITPLKEAERLLREANNQLEQRVAERTAELQQAKEVAEAANLAKNAFLTNMSHELRTPLNAIMGYAQILARSPQIQPEQQGYLRTIYQCSTHLLTLIEDILDFSKIEAGKMDLYPQEFFLIHFLQEVVEICRIKAEQKNISFIYQCDTALPTVIEADEKRLRQVLLNLLSNAIKFTDQGSVTLRIKVGQTQPSGKTKLTFEVEDTGIGINCDHFERIFLPFEQVVPASRRSEGTGLGLPIAQKILQLINSNLKVESTPNVGSCFSFTVDLPTSHQWQITSSPFPTIKGYQGNRQKILVVDDFPHNCEILIQLLQPLGFILAAAYSGQEGLEQAIEFQPDLMIIDLLMSDLNGWEMSRQLRQMTEFKDLILIASSASVSLSDRLLTREVGYHDFLPKPVQFSVLLDILVKYLPIQWIYDQQLPETPQSSPVIAPSTEILRQLKELAYQGRISAILKHLEQVEQSDEQLLPFSQHLSHLAQEFDLVKMIRFLEQY